MMVKIQAADRDDSAVVTIGCLPGDARESFRVSTYPDSIDTVRVGGSV